MATACVAEIDADRISVVRKNVQPARRSDAYTSGRLSHHPVCHTAIERTFDMIEAVLDHIKARCVRQGFWPSAGGAGLRSGPRDASAMTISSTGSVLSLWAERHCVVPIVYLQVKLGCRPAINPRSAPSVVLSAERNAYDAGCRADGHLTERWLRGIKVWC